MRLILFLYIISIAYASDLDSIKDNIKDAEIIIVGDVIESIEDSHLIKINKWAKGNIKSKFIKVHAKRKLQHLQTYMFAIDDIKDDHFWVNNPLKSVYELKSMGDYEFLVRAYNSDKPLIGQIELNSLMDYVRKDLDLDIKSRTSDRFDRKVSQISNNSRYKTRLPASTTPSQKQVTRVSELWLIMTFCFLIFIAILFRKTRL